MIRPLFAAGAIALAAMTATPAFAGDHDMPRTISLTGHGEVRLAPDIAIVSLGVSNDADAAKDALAANSTAMRAVLAALQSAGVAEKDTQTSNFSIQPRYTFTNDGKPPVLAGYTVANSVTVVVRKIDSLGAVLDAVVQAGSNTVNGIQFDVSKPEAALDEARKLAVADARHKAEILAAAGKVELGHILSIAEAGSPPPPGPIMRSAMKMDAAPPVPIAQGEQSLAVDVNIVWEIK